MAPMEPHRPSGARARRPRWVYGTGDEPDYRYSLANERTFLAWVRTGLAFLAAGVALDTVTLTWSAWFQTVLATVLVLVGLVCGLGAWAGWARAERAMRRGEPLRTSGLGLPLALVLAAVGLAVVLQGL